MESTEKKSYLYIFISGILCITGISCDQLDEVIDLDDQISIHAGILFLTL